MLQVYSSNYSEVLFDLLAEHFCQHPLDWNEKEVLIIQNLGMRHYLSWQLAEKTGICAHTEFMFPAQFLWQCYRHVQTPAETASPLYDSTMSQRLLSMRVYDLILSKRLDDLDELRPLWQKQGQEYAVAKMIADVFDEYLVFRPDWLLDWEEGGNSINAQQAELWRRIDLANPRAQLRRKFMALLAGEKRPDFLPKRLHLFGISTLPQIDEWLLLARHCEVYFYWLNPCAEYWGDVISPRRHTDLRLRSPQEADLYSEDTFLGYYGKPGRDFLDTLLNHDVDLHDASCEPQSTGMLGELQRYLWQPSEYCATARSPDDSVSIHSVSSPLREVQVVYDQILAAFAQDASLRPEDVAIMMPDLDVYSSLIKMVFSQKRFPLPLHFADRSERDEQSVADFFLQSLALLQSDADRASLLDFFAHPILRAAFQLSDRDGELLQNWLEQAHVYWGYAHELPQAPFTLSAALRRLVLAMYTELGETGFGEVCGECCVADDADERLLLDKLTFIVNDIEHYSAEIHRERDLHAWQELLRQFWQRWMVEQPWMNAEQLPHEDIAEVFRALRLLGDEATVLKAQAPWSAAAVSAYLNEHLQGRAQRQPWLNGRITVCTLQPMRVIPFQVIVLMGMNDDAFPRQDQPNHFNLIHRPENARPGDRKPRATDAYLFLETLLSVRKRLIISYIGQDPQSNATRQAAAPICELLHIFSEKLGYDAQALHEQIVYEHPLYPHDELYYNDEQQRFFTYRPAPALQRSTLPPLWEVMEIRLEDDEANEPIDPEQLLDFLASPLDYFLKQRLAFSASSADDYPAEDVPQHEVQVLNHLQRWNLRKQMLHGEKISLEKRYLSGDFPNGHLAQLQYQREQALYDEMQRIFGGALPLCEDLNVTWQADPTLPPLSYRIDGLQRAQAQHVFITPSKLKLRSLWEAWLRHLLLNAQAPYETYFFTSDRLNASDRKKYSCTMLYTHWQPLSCDEADERLSELCRAYLQGRQRVPLYSYDNIQKLPTLKRTKESLNMNTPAEIAAYCAQQNISIVDLEKHSAFQRMLQSQAECMHQKLILPDEMLIKTKSFTKNNKKSRKDSLPTDFQKITFQ